MGDLRVFLLVYIDIKSEYCVSVWRLHDFKVTDVEKGWNLDSSRPDLRWFR